MDSNDILAYLTYGVAVIGFIGIPSLTYIVNKNIAKDRRKKYEEVKSKLNEDLTGEEAVSLYKDLMWSLSFRTKSKEGLTKEEGQTIRNLEKIISPIIESEIEGKELTPRTMLEKISPTYAKLNPYDRN